MGKVLTNFMVKDEYESLNPDFEALLKDKRVDGKSLSTHFHEAEQRRYQHLPTYLKKVSLGCPNKDKCCQSENDVEKFIIVDFNDPNVRKRYNPTCENHKQYKGTVEVQLIVCKTCGEYNERKKWYQETDTCPSCEWTSTRTKGCAKMICRCGVKWCWFCKKIKTSGGYGVCDSSCDCGH